MAASASINRDDAPVPADESLPQKSSNAILWLLLLLAVLAAIWFYYNRSASNVAVAPTTTPAITSDAQQAAAQAEREQADAATARKTARAERASASRERAVAKPRVADRGPEPIARLQPKYPPLAYRNREEGSVLVRADVDANGTPTDVTVVRRSGSRDLDNAARDAVREWHFRPAIENGKAVASTVEVPIDFKLGEQ